MNKGAIHPKIVIDGNVQVGTIFHHGSTIFNISANTQQQEASYIDNPASAETDSPDGDSSIDDGAPVSAIH